MSGLPEVVDLFCGVGALSHGLKLAGCNILAGYDTDARCKHAYEKNNDAEFIEFDVGELTADDIKTMIFDAGQTPVERYGDFQLVE